VAENAGGIAPIRFNRAEASTTDLRKLTDVRPQEHQQAAVTPTLNAGAIQLQTATKIESAVIGAVLIQEACLLEVRQVLPDSNLFYSFWNRRIYGAILELADMGVPIDVLTVTERLRTLLRSTARSGVQAEDLDRDISVEVTSRAGEMYTAMNAKFHAELVLTAWRRRAVAETLQTRHARLHDYTQDVEVTLAELEEDIANIRLRSSGGRTEEAMAYRGSAIVKRRREGIIRRVQATPIFTGYSALDRKVIDPFFSGGISVLAGRPSTFKSTLKANLVKNLCNAGFGVQSVTPEQGFDREMDRLDAIFTGIPLSEVKGVRSWPPGDPRIKKILNANGQVYSNEWNFSVMARRDVSWSDVERQVTKDAHAGFQTHVIFVDLMDRLMEVREAKQADKAYCIHELLVRASSFAQRAKCHVMMLAQINRDAKFNDDGRPSLNTIKGSGAWEEVCDNVFLLHCPDHGLLDIIIGKQRDGEAGDDVVVRMPIEVSTLTIADRDFQNVDDPSGVSRLDIRSAA